MISFLDPRLPRRAWKKITPCPMSGCWLWIGKWQHQGYGIACLPNRASQVAHRWVYRMLVGEVPAGLDLDHLCRVRCCVNPAHIEPVSHRENILRGDTFGARNVTLTHCPSGHEYAGDNLLLCADGARKCRACHRERELARHHRNATAINERRRARYQRRSA